MHNLDVAIIDYGVGNLFSIKHACTYVGLNAGVTNDKQELLNAKVVILPGVGAFGDAMQALKKLDLVEPIHDIVAKGTRLLGICLGQQLLFDESEEFGSHPGLGLIPGVVKYFPVQEIDGRTYKVPQVGWNTIEPPSGGSVESWNSTLLEGVKPGVEMYFVHSCYVAPENPETVLTESQYGDVRFCSACSSGNVTAFQFHPERSGEVGISIYKNLANYIQSEEMK
ncbi:imidazole glycerol phosphate synthase subunit HisH [Pseudodesulfovibrio sp. zrk46]|uniref:imidazole glycerol phosphate synthase subunit HisH n=1 Tax=Pseudodesulfovibrio sp. zrk46 TaxID=2725288 RepID=UPI00144951D9|nr:imidazole glycerol phosphate synthase subunit HisH [Pseudodesulfovibrio sp. zrk46]QJB56578.1 imidazole glycerol phosphate synthase subunit HisH [Pseudodesulfovibrio sp. zrk46]